jgi:hypothetical protein
MARTVLARPILGKYPKPLIHCTGKPETGKSQLAISFALWLARRFLKVLNLANRRPGARICLELGMKVLADR